ncbi:hypothetical protein HMH01_15805 [Halovulum dunhuangense]|uniref:Uncharacterized protein n=1 Tax=Halovulum dunhuangense TaxID=1505036 RepID=A0A849L6Y5_9RHOB|nr:hypothetical protein [Halovulum dunhuangense]NNU81902.1 hypothetical protein [Halovulum dunhuangense]
MSGRAGRVGGSRFLYEPFDVNAARIETHERVTEERWINLERRLHHIEIALDRVERRMWLAATGLAGFLAAEVALRFLTMTQ